MGNDEQNGSPHSFKKRRLNQTTTSNDFTEEQLHSFREQLNALKTIKKTNDEANNISVDDFLENEEEEQIKNKKEKTMISEAITTECEWTHFLDSRYSAVSNLRNESCALRKYEGFGSKDQSELLAVGGMTNL